MEESILQMSKAIRVLTESRRFQTATTLVILLAAILMGLETSGRLMAAHGPGLRAANVVIQIVFTVEILLRLLAHAPRFHRFFRDGWNLFDFAVVAVSFLPAAGPTATVARLARLLRVGRLVSISAELRLIVDTMLRSIPSLGQVALLLGVLLYIYGVFGYHHFREADALHWGSLQASLLTLFQVLTLEGWVEVQSRLAGHHPWVWIYFASFILVAVFVVVNLFIAVVLNNLEMAKAEREANRRRNSGPTRGGLAESAAAQAATASVAIARAPLAQEDLRRRVAELRRHLESLEAELGAEG